MAVVDDALDAVFSFQNGMQVSPLLLLVRLCSAFVLVLSILIIV